MKLIIGVKGLLDWLKNPYLIHQLHRDGNSTEEIETKIKYQSQYKHVKQWCDSIARLQENQKLPDNITVIGQHSLLLPKKQILSYFKHIREKGKLPINTPLLLRANSHAILMYLNEENKYCIINTNSLRIDDKSHSCKLQPIVDSKLADALLKALIEKNSLILRITVLTTKRITPESINNLQAAIYDQGLYDLKKALESKNSAKNLRLVEACAYTKDWSRLKKLLQMGADANQRLSNGQSLLHYSITANATASIILLLIYKGAEVWQNDKGITDYINTTDQLLAHSNLVNNLILYHYHIIGLPLSFYNTSINLLINCADTMFGAQNRTSSSGSALSSRSFFSQNSTNESKDAAHVLYKKPSMK